MSDNSDGQYDYKPRQIENMEDRFFRFGEGRISGAAACHWAS